MSDHRAHIVVGVVPNQCEAVVRTAAAFARRFDADLVCAIVDGTRYPVGERPDGTVVSSPMSPDDFEQRDEVFDVQLGVAIGAVLKDSDVSWSVRALAGVAATELAKLADRLDAEMIVVGSRRPGLKGTLAEFFNGSVAASLAHHQRRPVLVVPVSPTRQPTLKGEAQSQ